MKRFVLIALVSLVALAAARPGIRGYPVGSVTEVDRKACSVSVDLGAIDGVFKGFSFAVVDEKGHQVATITAREVYSDLFWSEKLAPGSLAGVMPGMQVRWVLTPEVTALVEARRLDTAAAYRRFITVFPDSRFVPDLIASMPEATLRELDPEYYEAWKKYTKDAFTEFIGKHPKSGLAGAARREIASIESYEKERQKERLERAKRAEEAEEQRKRQEAIEEKIRAKTEQAMPGRELLGKLMNNSTSPVRFVFDPPSQQPPVNVPGGGVSELRHPQGSFKYKVYSIDEKALPPLPDEQPKPLKEGTVDIQFDFWQITYP